MKSSSSIAKISRPNLARVVPRERLFRMLDAGTKRPVVWVAAPAGAGKTTLIASWLDARKPHCIWYQVDEGDSDAATFFHYMGLAVKNAAPSGKKALPSLSPEYLPGLSTFTRRYFEALFERLSADRRSTRRAGIPAVIVLDNYQEASPDSLFHGVIVNGLEVIPEGMTVIIISRTDPPAYYARLRASGWMSYIGWDDIKLTLDESRTISSSAGQKKIAENLLSTLHQGIDGWAAGLILMIEMAKTSETGKLQLGDIGREGIFDYFAKEIIDKIDEGTRDFLLKTAFLPRVSVPMAERMSGSGNAGPILERLSRNHFFTQKHIQDQVFYQYHPLFREFLLYRSRNSFDAPALSGIMRRASVILGESGMIEDAAALAIEDRDWDALTRLIVDHAGALLAQGRNRTLDHWLSAVPPGVADDNPWLLYWHGIAKMHLDIQDSRLRLEHAYELFRRKNDRPGLFLCWCWIIDTYVYQWRDFAGINHWIAEMEKLLKEHPGFPSEEIRARVIAGMFYALMHRRPDHPNLPLWEDQLREVLLRSEDASFRTMVGNHLVLYYTWWTGEQEKAEALLRTLRPPQSPANVPPLIFIAWRAIEAAHHWMEGRHDLCQKATEEARAVADEADVHLWDFLLFGHSIFIALADGHYDAAREYLDVLNGILDRKQHTAIARYHYLLSWEAICLNKPSLALSHAKTGLKITVEAEMPALSVLLRTAVIEGLVALEKYDDARDYIDETRKLAAETRMSGMLYQIHWLEALMNFREGNEEAGLDALAQHLHLGKKLGLYNNLFWRAEVMGSLYARALEADMEAEYVREIIHRRGLRPNTSVANLESWPWPLKVYTLGRFAIIKNGEPVVFSRKVQKKTLELLKAVIAFGGEDVREEQISDLLWPDADGDGAHNSFKMALSRLRQLIGNESLDFREGKVTLNSGYVWVDAAAFRIMEEKTGRAWKKIHDLYKKEREDKAATAEAVRLAEKAFSLYRGMFLADDDSAWAVSMRERLRTRLMNLVVGLGEYYERDGDWKAASGVYEKGIEADRFREEFYQRLMICHKNLGQQAEAVSVYNRCRAELTAGLGISPSSKTEAICSSLRK